MTKLFTLLLTFLLISFSPTHAESIGLIDVESTCRINTASNSWIFTNNGEAKVRVRYQVLPDGRLKNLWLDAGQSKTVSQNQNLGSLLEVTFEESTIQLEGSAEVCAVDGIELTSVCSSNPNTRRWRVRNPNNFRVLATYELYGTDLTGSVVLPRAGKGTEKWAGDGIFEYKFFETRDVGGPNTLKLYYGDNQQTTKASGNQTCDLPESSVTAAAVCSDNDKRNLWEVYNSNPQKVFITRSDNGKTVSVPAATVELNENEQEIIVPGVRRIYTSRSTAQFGFSYGAERVAAYELDGNPCYEDPIEPILADIYYADSKVGVELATIFAVHLDDQTGQASMQRIFDVPFGTHIAVTRDNRTMYLMGGGSLWSYDLINHQLSEVGSFPYGSVIQVSINLEDELWAVSQTHNTAYHVDPSDASVIRAVALDVNISNGDLVFTSDGAFLTGKNTLRSVDLSTGTTTTINSIPRDVNGMAVLGQGKGDLIIATKDLDHFITLDQVSGEQTGSYDAYFEGEKFTMSWGDMATGHLYPRFDGCQLYLADQDSRAIYTVAPFMDESNALVSSLFPYPENYRDPHIALNLTGDRLYLIDSESPNKYGYYDLTTFNYHEVGILNGIGKVTQATFSPYGELFFSSNNSDQLYVFTDIESGTFESYGEIRIDNTNNTLKIEGSDIAFDQDGTFYVASNQTPDDIYQVSGVKGHLLAVPIVNNLGKHITGLAVDDDGHLLVSFYRSSTMMHINTSTFERTDLSIGGDITRNGYGDMSSACFDQLAFCDGYAEEVIEYNPGTLANGTGTPPQERMNASLALGQPQETDVINFVSLGFGGDMTVELASPVYNHNKNGVYVDNEKSINYGEKSMADIVIVETSFGRRQSNCGPDRNKNYPEKLLVYGKQSLTDPEWVLLSDPEGECRSSFIDVAPAIAAGMDYVKYLKLVDITDPRYFPGNADGFDVDGIIICPGEVVAAITGAGRDGSPIANARTLNEGEAYSEDFFNKAPNEVYPDVFDLVSIYPNPVVTNDLRLSINSNWEVAQYEILDINGRSMSVGQVDRFDPKITMNSMVNGLYVLRVKVAGQEQSIKFTIKR